VRSLVFYSEVFVSVFFGTLLQNKLPRPNIHLQIRRKCTHFQFCESPLRGLPILVLLALAAARIRCFAHKKGCGSFPILLQYSSSKKLQSNLSPQNKLFDGIYRAHKIFSIRNSSFLTFRSRDIAEDLVSCTENL
jgi:hypothetical protein